MKPSFIIHTDSLTILDKLTTEQKGILFDAIYKYHLDELVELDPLMDIVFTPFKNQFDRDWVKYKKVVDRNRLNGLKGGRPKYTDNQDIDNNPEEPKETQQNPSGFIETQSNPKNLDSDNDSVNDNESDSINDSKKESDLESSDKPNHVLPESIKRIPKQPKLNKEEEFNKRREEFKLQVKQFTEKYPYQMLSDFYSYWSEKKPNGYKMRFELEPVFEIDRRLKTWERKSKEFQKSELPANVGGGSKLKAL